jgi:hypothetical protein
MTIIDDPQTGNLLSHHGGSSFVLRNLQTHSEPQGTGYGAFYSELELVHNLASCLVVPEFGEADAYRLRGQGLAYVKNGRHDLPFYQSVCALLAEVAAIMPEELKSKFHLENASLQPQP